MVIHRIACLFALGFLVGCQPSISEQDLDFLATQTKPRTAQLVAKQLGNAEPGPGPCYAYRLRGSQKVVEFWFAPPSPTARVPKEGIPVEIALTLVRQEGAKPEIIWPENLKGQDFDKVIPAIWPQKQ